MSDSVKCEYKGKFAVITINNQKKLNALDRDGYYQLAKYMREVATHDEVFITVLTGKGMLSAHIIFPMLISLRSILLRVGLKVCNIPTPVENLT
jgi:enoyl-CoA hydratase/carnithine racemase